MVAIGFLLIRKMKKNKYFDSILAFLNPYIASCFGYITIRIFMGVFLNTIGKIYLAILGLEIFISTTFSFIYFIKTKRKRFYYTTDQWLYILLTVAVSCLLIELFMLEAYVFD